MRDATIKASGTPYDARWTITANSGCLSGDYVTDDDPLCILVDVAIGEVFHAELAVRPSDGSLLLPDDVDDISAAKQRIIQSLIVGSVSTADSQGWITLGRQKLTVVRADSAQI